MRQNLTFHVPQNNNVSYSLFTRGLKIAAPTFDEKENEWIFTFLGGSTVVLFYYFENFSRVYVVTAWESEKDGEKYKLPGVEQDLCVLYTGLGHKISGLERILKHLTKNDEYAPFRLPLLFWYRLGTLIQCRKSRFSYVDNLYHKFAEGNKNGRKRENDLCS